MEPIILIGGGGHCHSCIDVIECHGRYEIKGIVDIAEKVGQMILGYRIIGDDDQIPELMGISKNFFITIGNLGNPALIMKIYASVKELGGVFPAIISPLAHIGKCAFVDEGSIIMHHALVNTNVQIGKNCIINTKALIEHDAVVEDFCHISTGAIVNGGARVGFGTFMGSGSVCKQGATIPQRSFIKMHNAVI